MSFLAKLKLGDNDYTVLEVDYEVSQTVDRRNMPNDAPSPGFIRIVVETGSKSELFAWGCAPNMTKNGEITFFRRDAASPLKTLKFFDGFCIRHQEVFQSDGDVPMKTFLTISPREIECQGVDLAQSWPGFNSSNNGSGSDGGSTAAEPANNGAIPSFIP